MKPTKLAGIGKKFDNDHASAHESKASDAKGFSRLTSDLAESLQVELAESWQVSSPAEVDAAAALAMALAKWMELEAVMKVKVAQERATATVRFDRLAADAFDRDKAAWMKDPVSRTSIFARTYCGAMHLSEIWARVLRELKAGEDIPFELACQALLAMGSHWQVDKADEHAMTIMATFVKVSSDPAHAAEVWARESKMRDGLAFARKRVEKAVSRAPSADECRRRLILVATQEADGWKRAADDFRPEFEAARSAARDCAVGLGTGDPVLEKELRSLNRIATRAQDRAEKLQRNLEMLICKRDANGRNKVAGEPNGDRASRSEAHSKSKAGRSAPSLRAVSRAATGAFPVPAEPKTPGATRGRGPHDSARNARQTDGLVASAMELPEIHDGVQPAEMSKAASMSDEGGAKSGPLKTDERKTRSVTARLTPSERRLLKMMRKVPDSPRRRNDIVRLFGSEQRFRELCEAMDAR